MWDACYFGDNNLYSLGSNENEFEVGWAYEGYATSEEEVAALQELLNTVGSSLTDWFVAPHIRVERSGSYPTDFGIGPIGIKGRLWCVYGVATKAPTYGLLEAGVRMPLRKDMIVP